MLINERSGLLGDTRLVGDQVQKRLGTTDFGDLVHDGFSITVMLVSQEVICCRRIHGLSCVLLSSLSRPTEHPRMILAPKECG